MFGWLEAVVDVFVVIVVVVVVVVVVVKGLKCGEDGAKAKLN